VSIRKKVIMLKEITFSTNFCNHPEDHGNCTGCWYCLQIKAKVIVMMLYTTSNLSKAHETRESIAVKLPLFRGVAVFDARLRRLP